MAAVKSNTNAQAHRDMLWEAGAEIGRAVEKCREQGIEGKTLKDFIKQPNVAAANKTAETAMAAMVKEADIIIAARASAKTLIAKRTALVDTIQKEVDSRTKKKDRKVLAVDSKSLPLMEDLIKDLNKQADSFLENTVKKPLRITFAADKEQKIFDDLIERELSKSKDVRAEEDQDALDSQGFDVRLIKRNHDKVMSNLKAGRESLTKAIAHQKAKEAKEANANIAAAMENQKVMDKLHAPYAKVMASKGKDDLNKMSNSKDGKYAIEAIEHMGKAVEGLNGLIKKTLRAGAGA